MALIQVSVIENVLTPEQKRQIVEKLTEAMLEVTGQAMRPVTWVTIQDVPGGAWGIGGRPLAAEDVRAIAQADPRPKALA